MQSLPVQFSDLLLIQLTNWRWTWRSHLLLGTVAPLMSTLALGVFAMNSGTGAQSYIVTGSVVMSLLFGILGQVSSHFAFIRHSGQLEFFATLPIARIAFVLATVCAFFLISLPSALITLLAGAALLRVPLSLHPLLIVVLPLISLSLCGLGVLLGLLSRNMNESGMITNLANLGLLFLGPVLIPPTLLPDWMRVISLLSPATYAASALRQVTIGTEEFLPLGLNLGALVAIGAVLLWIATRRIQWRK